MRWQATRWAVVTAVDLAVLVGLRPHPRSVGRLAHLSAWVAQVGGDRVVAALAELALWTVAAWVGLGLLAMLASAAPGAFGRTARRFARRTLPRGVQRFVAGGLGLSVLLAPAMASAATPGHPAVAAAPTASPAPTPNWPVLPTPNWPTQQGQRPAGQPQHEQTPTQADPTQAAGGHHAAEHPAQRPDSNGIPHGPAPQRGTPTQIVVQPGDTLWAIAAEHLPAGARTPARTAASWPRWYAANRAVIGDDPGLIRPGQQLRPPRVHPGPQQPRHSSPSTAKETSS